jgi:hypothetical protein
MHRFGTEWKLWELERGFGDGDAEPLPFVVVRRKAFPNSFSNGLSVIEQASPRDRKRSTNCYPL